MFHTLDTFDTEFSADSVEWCPSESDQDKFVCGTYQLSKEDPEKPSKRLGRIYLMRVTVKGTIQVLQQIQVSGILDMKWCRVQCYHKTLLGTTNAAGYLQIYYLDDDSLKLFAETQVKEDALLLSLDWCFSKQEINDPNIAVSDSKGSITFLKVGAENLEIIHSWHAHSFEAWIVSFDYWNNNVLYSGGDDCKFRCFDVRTENVQPLATNNTHGAGVTSFHSNSQKEHILASGSYDEILRLWDSRNLKRSISEINVGGGIWRLKWDPFNCERLLSACMYDGFKIIACNDSQMLNVIGEYKEHQSIAYGCDWSYLNVETWSPYLYRDGNTSLVGTCSFYDHILKLSIVHLNDDE